MASIINTNIASLNAQRNLNTSQAGLTTALQRLSSGLRINSAKDDAAGLAISQRMTSQINGLDQAARNANDGISLSQTAEGSLSAITDNLQRIRTLSLQAANSTNSSSDRAALNAEVQSSLAEIGRVASTSQFNGLNLLDGTFTASQFQVGANANQTINVTIGGAQLSQLGAYQYNNSAAPVSGTALVSGDLTINGVNVGASTTGGANDIVNSINSVTNQTGVTASATSSIVAANTPTNKESLLSGDLVINGTNIGAVSGSYDLVAQGTNVANAINLKTATTGVAATVNSTTGQISLASTTGKTIAITSSNGTAGASRVENATGLELSASTATATASLTITATAANSSTTLISNTSLNTKTFSVGSGANLQTYTLNDLNVAAGNVNGTSDGAGGHYISWDSTSGTAQADLLAAVTSTVQANNTSVNVTSSGGTNITFTSQAKGILLAADTTVTNTSGAPFSANVATAGTGITEGNTFVIDGTTYTFANNALANTVGSATTGTIGMRVASQNAIASNIAAAVTTAHGLATPTSGVSASAATNAVTFATTLKGTAGNTQVLATGSAGAVAAAVVTATDGAYTASTTYGTISLNSSTNFSIAGANSAKAGLSTASSTLTAISTIDISSVTGANNAISLVDAAISQVNTTRAGLGAVQNRFSSAIANLQSSSENISAARSRIQDTDFAAETAALTRGQILQQAGTAMLAQANSLPNGVLALLR